MPINLSNVFHGLVSLGAKAITHRVSAWPPCWFVSPYCMNEHASQKTWDFLRSTVLVRAPYLLLSIRIYITFYYMAIREYKIWRDFYQSIVSIIINLGTMWNMSLLEYSLSYQMSFFWWHQLIHSPSKIIWPPSSLLLLFRLCLALIYVPLSSQELANMNEKDTSSSLVKPQQNQCLFIGFVWDLRWMSRSWGGKERGGNKKKKKKHKKTLLRETRSHFTQLSTITCNMVTSACPLPSHTIPLLKPGTRKISS